MENNSRQYQRLLKRKPWIKEVTNFIFAGPKFTYQIPKYIIPEKTEDNDIQYDPYNQRTKFKKAYKAFLKGKSVFKYMNQYQIVPKMTEQQMLEALVNSEEE